MVFSWSVGITFGLAISAIILPRGTPRRWLLGLPLLTLLVAPRAPPTLRITVLDVGEGLAVVVETAERLLVCDTGPKYSPQLDAGSAIIPPLLRRRGHGILLPGDIEKSAEKRLMTAAVVPNSLDLVLAPHHGSKTSSSAAFVAQMSPRHVVFSSGYLHQFGHPHAQVSERYSGQGSQLWSTAEQGAIVFS